MKINLQILWLCLSITSAHAQFVQQGNKLVGTGGAVDAAQGGAVAISADGNTAIVGGPFDSPSGAAWIFTRTGTTWAQQGTKLVGTGGTGSVQSQGKSVAISADGNTVLIGSSTDNSSQGAVWVFVRNGTTWTQQGNKLVGTGGAISQQGWSVALSADGNTALVGGQGDNAFQGAAWVFSRTGTTWTQEGNKLVGTGGVGNRSFGWSVALSADGNTALMGGAVDNSSKGAAWVFTRTGTTWTQQGNKLVGTGSVGESFQGSAVALSSDGNTAIVGGSDDNNNQGATWVFTRTGTTWAQQGNKLVGTGNTGAASQGASIAVSADGNKVIIGGTGDNSNQGAAWFFPRTGTTWAQQGNKLVGTGNMGAASQGKSVAMSGNGSTVMVGGSTDSRFQGAVWVFFNAPVSTVDLTYAEKIKLYPNPANADLTIEMNENTEGVLLITNAIGQVVFQQKSMPHATLNIDVSLWASGVYFMRLGKDVVKFVKR
jgi:Secretion system C-terminal sorting domain